MLSRSLGLSFLLFFHSQSVGSYAYHLMLKIAAVALGSTTVVKSRRFRQCAPNISEGEIYKSLPLLLYLARANPVLTFNCSKGDLGKRIFGKGE